MPQAETKPLRRCTGRAGGTHDTESLLQCRRMRLVWLSQAQADIQRLYDFLIEQDPRAAERAVRAIQLGAQKLLEFSRVGRRMDDATERRELFVPFGAGAYVLRYRIHADTIVVLRVWHSREERL